MKMHKFAAALILTTLLVLGTVATALAAPNDDVIQALKDAKIPETYIIQAENYLKTHELTEEEVNAVMAHVEKAVEIMEKSGTKDITKLTVEDKKQILELVADAGEAIGISVSVKKNSDGTYTVAGTDSTGNEVVNFTTNEVKQTGINYMVLLAGIAVIIAAAGSYFLIKKNVVSTNAA